MEKNKYTEYVDVIHGVEGNIEVIVQVPDDHALQVHIIEKQGTKIRIRTLDEWSDMNKFISEALAEAGYEKIEGR